MIIQLQQMSYVNQLVKLEILTLELWTSTLKKPNAIVQPFVADIEDKKFYDDSPESIAHQKSEAYRINSGLRGTTLE
jgi:hypothetical protein